MGCRANLELNALRNLAAESSWLSDADRKKLTKILDLLEREFYERRREIGFVTGAPGRRKKR
jgi:hypothetical protein